VWSRKERKKIGKEKKEMRNERETVWKEEGRRVMLHITSCPLVSPKISIFVPLKLMWLLKLLLNT
jgi:hypothetical protein